MPTEEEKAREEAKAVVASCDPALGMMDLEATIATALLKARMEAWREGQRAEVNNRFDPDHPLLNPYHTTRRPK